MNSPFPGMDPYLEERWPEVHASLIVYARNQINAQLPNELQANIEQNLSVHLDEERSHGIRPDVHVSEEDATAPWSPADVQGVALAEPYVVKMPPFPYRHIEIVDRRGRVITAIEFISPWNKVGLSAREQYARKQLDYLDARVNLVEIDLVRQGSFVLAASLTEFPEELRTPYMICIFRSNEPDVLSIYRAPLQEPLPNIPIPLRPTDRDAVLQLQPLIDDCYRDGRYHRIDYTEAPKAPFDESDSNWIDSRLRELGKRS